MVSVKEYRFVSPKLFQSAAPLKVDLVPEEWVREESDFPLSGVKGELHLVYMQLGSGKTNGSAGLDLAAVSGSTDVL